MKLWKGLAYGLREEGKKTIPVVERDEGTLAFSDTCDLSNVAVHLIVTKRTASSASISGQEGPLLTSSPILGRRWCTP